MANGLAIKVQRLRKRKMLSRHDLSQLTGLTREAIRLIEKGITRSPSVETLMALADALGCPVADLMPTRPMRKATPDGSGEGAR